MDFSQKERLGEEEYSKVIAESCELCWRDVLDDGGFDKTHPTFFQDLWKDKTAVFD